MGEAVANCVSLPVDWQLSGGWALMLAGRSNQQQGGPNGELFCFLSMFNQNLPNQCKGCGCLHLKVTNFISDDAQPCPQKPWLAQVIQCLDCRRVRYDRNWLFLSDLLPASSLKAHLHLGSAFSVHFLLYFTHVLYCAFVAVCFNFRSHRLIEFYFLISSTFVGVFFI